MKKLNIEIPIETEVINTNSRMVTCAKLDKEEKCLYVDMDVRQENWGKLLGLPKGTKVHWADVRTVIIKELSSFLCPMYYRLTYGDGWYQGKDGVRHYFPLAPHLQGIDLVRRCTTVTIRAAVLLAVMSGVGLRTVCWLMKLLFNIILSKSSLDRWIKSCAANLPDAEGMARLLNEDKPITEGHFDEIFAKGQRPKKCTIVLRDEHGRIFAVEEVDERTDEVVTAFLKKVKSWGIDIKVFYVDGCEAYRNAIQVVYKDAKIQYDYFHIVQNIWRKLWGSVVHRRREIKDRGETVNTKSYGKQLLSLAKRIWKHRWLFFKNDKNMSEDERAELQVLLEADHHLEKVRGFAEAVWDIFEESESKEQAESALGELTNRPEVQPNSVFKKIVSFLESRFQDMTTYVREKGVKRNSLAETGIRCLRRLERGHDGFRGKKGLDCYVRIYQAVKYLGWSVHRITQNELGLPCRLDSIGPPDEAMVSIASK